jgi:hypothetical protein
MCTIVELLATQKMRKAHRLVLALLVCLPPLAAAATNESADGSVTGWVDTVRIQAGVGTHWNDDDEYTTVPVLGGVEAVHDDRHHVGISLFNNSFDQFAQYYYYAYRWQLPAVSESAYLKLSGGLIYGYVDEFEDKLEFNQNGWAPVIIPSLGWKRKNFNFDVAVLGGAGVMFLVGYDLWQR